MGLVKYLSSTVHEINTVFMVVLKEALVAAGFSPTRIDIWL